MCIIQIRELVTRLSDDFTQEHKEIPWHEIKAMRNLHAHDYEKVDFDTMWQTFQNDIPELKDKLKKIIENLE